MAGDIPRELFRNIVHFYEFMQLLETRQCYSYAMCWYLTFDQVAAFSTIEFLFVNDLCHFNWSMPSLVTKLFGIDDAISVLV